jgi:hypothetical protein
MTDQVASNNTRWHNAVFYKCCYHEAEFRITTKGEKCMKGIKERMKDDKIKGCEINN